MSDAENSAPETPEDSKKSLSRDDSSGNDDIQDVNGEKSESKSSPQKKEKSNVKKKSPKKSSHKKESSSEDDEEEDDEKPSKKDQTEHNAKKDKKEDEDDDEEDDDDEDDDEKDKKVALLDQPLEVSGSRERKKVERLALSFNLPSKEKKADIPEGEGTKLGECPRIEFQIQKAKVDDLKALHKVLFNRPGSNSEIRKNIRMFCGFPFKRTSQEFTKKKGSLERLNLSVLKKLCNVLDVDRGKTKDDMVNKLLEFLMKPSPTGKKVPAASKRKSTTKSGKKSSTKKKRNARSRKNLDKDDSKSDSDSEEAELDDDDTEDEAEEEEEEDEESEEGEEAVAAVASEKESEESEDNKKGKGKKPVSRKTPRKETKAKEEPKKEDKPTTAKVQPKRKNDESEGDDSSDDEPLAKKSKQPPSDEEIKTLIKKILDGANLEEITMKTVCKQVYATYPEFDLSERKNFIKETVKSIIS